MLMSYLHFPQNVLNLKLCTWIWVSHFTNFPRKLFVVSGRSSHLETKKKKDNMLFKNDKLAWKWQGQGKQYAWKYSIFYLCSNAHKYIHTHLVIATCHSLILLRLNLCCVVLRYRCTLPIAVPVLRNNPNCIIFDICVVCTRMYYFHSIFFQ